MKQFLTAAVVTAGLLSGASAFAQGPPPGAPPGGGFDDGTTVTTTTTMNADESAYAATGWNPALLLALSGGLAAGSVALKGFLRKRTNA